ncbi:hypothetical protein B296_00006622 [Ensete ventricosum]|uniref:Uncharacterized protein n=1 Tax=Ensete ventricosum TaxID=4639 RepID=A0A427ATM0_ENSVE|nr:hypothetical protein B296_00006622 [Ensete ventricosum]
MPSPFIRNNLNRSPCPHHCFLCLSFVSNTRTAVKESLTIQPQKPLLPLLPLPPSPFSPSAVVSIVAEDDAASVPTLSAIAHSHYDIILAAITILAVSSSTLCRATSRVSFPNDYSSYTALSSTTQ